MMHTTSALGVSAKRVLGKIFLTVLLATFGLSARAAVPTLAVNFDSLPDGTNYPKETVLDAKAKQIQVKISNSGHKK